MYKDKQTEYRRYDTRAKEILSSGSIAEEHTVLELGSGTGLHTYALVRTGARVVASDISSHSLDVLERRIKGRLTTMTGDMEALPFDDESFDVICSAGSLSYGDPVLVNAEIVRLLRSDGIYLCGFSQSQPNLPTQPLATLSRGRTNKKHHGAYADHWSYPVHIKIL